MAVNMKGKGGAATAPASNVAPWMKTGKAAAESFQKEEVMAEEREKERGKAWRFFMKKATAGVITFLDGEINPETKLLDVPMYYEHTVKLGGDWKNYVCIGEEEPCPLCEGGDRPNFVAALTVVDHRVVKSQDGTKVFRDSKRLFVCKRGTLKVLNQMAIKRDGLTLCTFDVMRTGEKDPNVGNNYDFTKKWEADDFGAAYDNLDDLKPINYAEAIPRRSADELRKLGFGGGTAIGAHGEQEDEGVAVEGSGL